MIKSKVMFTEEIDDLETAVEELASQAEGFTLRKNSVGLLFMDPDTEYEELYPLLKERWDIPFIGATALAILTGEQGYCKSGISLMILTSDDCGLVAGMTESMTRDEVPDKIAESFKSKEQELKGEEVKVILAYDSKTLGMVGDHIIDSIERLGMKVPIYGALASDAFQFKNYKVYFNEKVGVSALAYVLITGNVSPRFMHISSISGKANFSYEVTESKEDKVYRLGSGTFVEALEKADMMSDKPNVIADYIMTPFITTLKKPDGRSVEAMRNLVLLNREEGCGQFLGGVPEGASLEIGFLNGEEVSKTVKEAFDTILGWMEEKREEGYTILCSSCVARYMGLGKNVAVEAESYKGRLPGNASLMGMYSYGELCPVGDEEPDNIFHNSTFTVMVL